MSEEEVTQEGKVSRIRQRDKSRKIPLGKPAGRDQRMNQGGEGRGDNTHSKNCHYQHSGTKEQNGETMEEPIGGG